LDKHSAKAGYFFYGLCAWACSRRERRDFCKPDLLNGGCGRGCILGGMEKQCSKCGTTFTCQNEQSGCWCEGLVLSKEVLDELWVKYANCLCPECLKGYEGDEMIRAAESETH
jgi:hypothetical protein